MSLDWSRTTGWLLETDSHYVKPSFPGTWDSPASASGVFGYRYTSLNSFFNWVTVLVCMRGKEGRGGEWRRERTYRGQRTTAHLKTNKTPKRQGFQPGWPQIQCVTKDDLKFLILLLPPQGLELLIYFCMQRQRCNSWLCAYEVSTIAQLHFQSWIILS